MSDLGHCVSSCHAVTQAQPGALGASRASSPPRSCHFSYKFSFAFKQPEIRTNRNPGRAVQHCMSRCTSPFQALHFLWQGNICLSPTSLLYHHVQVNEFSLLVLCQCFLMRALFEFLFSSTCRIMDRPQ